ncbi:hypothetical protein Tco_1434496 [Tanacetum coccineum]
MYKEYLAEFWYSAKTLENSKVSFSIPTGVRPWFETIRYGETVPVKGTLKKSLLPPSWRLLMAQIIQCLGGKTEGFDQITNKDAIILYSQANGINVDYASIFWKDIIIKLNKRHREKVVPYTRFLSLLMIHKIKEGYGDGEPGAESGHKKHSTSSKQPSVSSKEATKDGSFKAPTSSKTGHLKRKKESSSAMDSNLSQTSASTPVVAEMHKEDQQVTGGPTSLGVTSEERVNPQLSSGMSAFNLNKHIYSAYFIIHSESASGNDASVVSIAEVDLENLLLVILYLNNRCSANFKDLDSPEDDPIIVVDDSDKDEEADEVHATTNSQKHKLELEKNKAEAEAALLKAQPFFPNVGQLNELLVKSLQTEFLKILSAHDFSSSLPTELKELPSKFNELTEEVKGLK